MLKQTEFGDVRDFVRAGVHLCMCEVLCLSGKSSLTEIYFC